MNWFTSDTHFGHANIIGYCARPFGDVDEMDRYMIWAWNEVVNPADTVYHLGDFAMGPANRVRTYRDQLNGRIVLIRGNHDRGPDSCRAAGFEPVNDAIVPVGPYRAYCRHVPEPDRTKWQGADFVLAGHVHERWRIRDGVLNVGVDQWGFRPISEAQILAVMRGG